MRLSERVLVHQVHPVKVSADVTASLLSNLLLWYSRPKTAAVIRIAIPIAGSVAVLSLADLCAPALLVVGALVVAADWSHPSWPRPARPRRHSLRLRSQSERPAI